MTDTHRGDGAPDASATPSDGDRSSAPGPSPVPVPPAPPGHGGPSGTADNPVGLLAVVLAIVALGALAGWVYVWIILGLLVMVFLHELGHFVTAKRSGMKVTEFFIGAGPRVWSFRRGETEYGVKVFPILAYVRIIGMNNLDEVDPADEERTYRAQSFPKRLLVVSAGSIMHMVQAFVILVVALGLVGVPGGSVTGDAEAEAWSVGEVTPDSAAEEAGLRAGDEIVAIDGERVQELDTDLSTVIGGYEVGDTLRMDVMRDGSERTLEATLGGRPSDVEGGSTGAPFLGVRNNVVYDDAPIGLGSAVVQAPGEMLEFTGASLGALAGFFSPDGVSDFASNVSNAREDADGGATVEQAPAREGEENRLVSIYGVVRMGADLWDGGVVVVLLLFFQINIFIGIFNMIPLPPFDGGHAAVAIYERLRSRNGRTYRADMAKLMPLTYAVVLALMMVGVSALYLDIVNPVSL